MSNKDSEAKDLKQLEFDDNHRPQAWQKQTTGAHEEQEDVGPYDENSLKFERDLDKHPEEG